MNAPSRRREFPEPARAPEREVGARIEGRSESAAPPIVVGGTRRCYRQNQEIFRAGEPAGRIYGVLTGAVRVYRILAEGRRHIAQFCLPGDVFGLEGDQEYRCSAEAVSNCELSSISQGALSSLAMNDPAVAQKLWGLSLHYLRRSEEHLLLLGQKSARSRVAWFLLDMAERTPPAESLRLPMSREDIADFLGLTMETVSRTLGVLQDEAVIALASSREVLLKDRMALHRLAA